MLLISAFHSDPALAAVIIFGGILGSLLAIPGVSVIPAKSRQQQRRR